MSAEASGERPIRVLYVDDEQSLLELASTYLEDKEGFVVSIAADADEAIRLQERNRYDAIISDYQMPRKDGIELLREVRGGGDGTPFIIFTGKGRERVVIEAFDLGADYYLQKGGDPASMFAELSNAVRSAVEAKRKADAFKASEEQYRLLFETAPVGILIAQEGGIVKANPALMELLGHDHDTLTERPFIDFIHPDDRDMVLDRHTRRMRGESPPTSYEFRIVTSSAETRHVHIDLDITTWQGSPASLSFITDITERKLHEESLKRKEEFQEVMMHLSTGFINMPLEDLDSGVADALAAVGSFSGADAVALCRVLAGECVGVVHSWTPAAPEGAVSATDSSFDRLSSACHELLKEGRDWSTKAEEGEAVCLPMEIDGELIGFVALYLGEGGRALRSEEMDALKLLAETLTSLESRRDMELRLRESESKYRHLVENVREVIYALDAEGRISYVSPNIEVLAGFSPEEVLGRSFVELVHPDDKEGRMDNFRRVLEGDDEASEYRYLTKDGSVRWVRTAARPIYEDGRAVGLRGILMDISDRKLAEDALRSATRKLNILSSITRHDILNTVTVLRGYLELCRDASDEETRDRCLDMGAKSASSIQEQVRFTAYYEEMGMNAPDWFHVHGMLDGISIPGPPLHRSCTGYQVFADPMIEMVFDNLMGNTVRHSGGATVVVVRCEERNDGLVIIWEDDGVGVPVGMKEEIFHRGVGEDTGLGLFLISEILDITGMTIRETGEPGEGARFEIHVPAGKWRLSPEEGR